jgi:alpha-L-fucosidase 2
MKLWYTKPAADWESEALPIGNGFLGGMVYGGTHKDRIQLNEHTLWSGGPGKNADYSRDIFNNASKEEARAALRSLQDTLQEDMIRFSKNGKAHRDRSGKIVTHDYPELSEEANGFLQKLKGNKQDFGSYQTLGELFITAPGTERTTGYKRELCLNDGIVREAYTQHGVTYKKEIFASYPGNIMVIRLTANQPGRLTRTFALDSVQPNKTVKAEKDTLTMTGWPSDHQAHLEKLLFALRLKAVPKGAGAKITASGNSITVTGADEILIVLSAGTNYRQCMDESFNYFSADDPLAAVTARVNAAADKAYTKLYKDHHDDYRLLFSRVKLDLGGGEKIPEKTTDELLAGYKGRGNTDTENRWLEALYYKYGRYLLISSSRAGSSPANLQGIWAQELDNPWSADYHTNVNVQMNYWLAEQTNLTECHEPMIEYIKSLAPRGKDTAKYYHRRKDGGEVRGWTVYHECNIWGYTLPAVSDAFWFPAGAAWLCQNIWERYAFTLDHKILEDNFRTLLGAALFWVDFLWEDKRDGTLVANPSWSPEHGHFSLGASSDQTMIWELFGIVLKASDILEIKTPEVDEVRAARAKLWLPAVGLNGQYMEWKDEVTLDVTGDNGHRHANHLFALHPGTLVVPGRNEEDDWFAKAIKKTLDTRGDGGTGWSMAWKINLWARLRDGNRAAKLLHNQLVNSTSKNLLDIHPPFQIDGNFGATAGMTEMLLQSHGDVIEILPALPDKWVNGSVYGLKARGNFEIGIVWTEGKPNGITVLSRSGSTCTLRGQDIGVFKVTNVSGPPVPFEILDSRTITFRTRSGGVYLVRTL